MDQTIPVGEIKEEQPTADKKPSWKWPASLSRKLGLLAIIMVVAAIPLTIVMSQQEQNTKQDAASSATQTCKSNGGTCMATSGCSSSTKWNGGYCNTYDSPGLYCCVKKTTTVSSKCTSLGGKCEDVNKYTCSQRWQTGLCPGASNIKCCYGAVKKFTSTPTPIKPTPTKMITPTPAACQQVGQSCTTNIQCCFGNNCVNGVCMIQVTPTRTPTIIVTPTRIVTLTPTRTVTPTKSLTPTPYRPFVTPTP